MDSKDLKNQAAEEAKALELDDLDQVTGGAGLGGNNVVLNPGRPNMTSGVLNQVTSGVLNQGVSGVTGHDAFSTKGIGLNEETDALNSNR